MTEPATFTAIGYHAPPITRHGDTATARAEALNRLTTIIGATLGAIIILGDWNSTLTQKVIARLRKPHGTVAGDLIDAVVGLGLRVTGSSYRTTVKGVRLRSDHHHALRVAVKPKGLRARFRRPVYLWWYNLRVGRPEQEVAAELNAILSTRRTLGLFMCEAVGYDLPDSLRFGLVRDRGTEARANLAAYVRIGHLEGHTWHDLRGRWRRTEHPGQHAPRAILEVEIAWRRAGRR